MPSTLITVFRSLMLRSRYRLFEVSQFPIRSTPSDLGLQSRMRPLNSRMTCSRQSLWPRYGASRLPLSFLQFA